MDVFCMFKVFHSGEFIHMLDYFSNRFQSELLQVTSDDVQRVDKSRDTNEEKNLG